MTTTDLKPLQEFTLLENLEKKAAESIPASIDDCIAIANAIGSDTDWNSGLFGALCDTADRVRQALHGDTADTCSIVNGRSGRCTEDCKWCAQAACHNTGCREYDFVSEQEYFDTLMANHTAGVKRFSIVCSGRKVAMKDIRRYCELYRRSRELSPISLCASMGLLNKEELQALYDAGVRRYHCNIETAASYFPTLCTTHTREDKLRTIRHALEVGMEVCSGGIIGMGETLSQRLEMAAESRDAGAVSIPVNLLNPIPGTPLQDTPLISEEDIMRTVATFRFILPKKALRFAGGRMRLSHKNMLRMMRGGMNGVLMGDMLTTVSNTIADDRKLFAEAGLDF